MERVLIVDDEQGYREHLGYYVGAKGYPVATAGNGREAIDCAVSFAPQILVADWMLEESIHGLHVASVLEILFPSLKTILITGFASPDLKAKAEENGLDFMEKPFSPAELEEALARAQAAARPSRKILAVPLLVCSSAGTVSYANPTAVRELGVDVGASCGDFQFDAEAAAGDWAEATVDSTAWLVRKRSLGDACLLAFLHLEQSHFLKNHPLLRMLLDHKQQHLYSLPASGRVLVIDDDELIRRFSLTIFERADALCHTAESHTAALKLFERDQGINLVILDYEMPGEDTAALVQELKRIRPQCLIVGNSGSDRKADFAALGVSYFLPKPWRFEDLVDLLKTR